MPFAAFVILVAIVAILENGVWVRPGVGFLQDMAAQPFENVLRDQPLKHYLYTSYLGIVIAHVVGAYRNVLAYAGLHLAEMAVLGAAALFWLRSAHGDRVARFAGVLFVCTPISTVLLTWLGIGDPLVLGLASLLVLARKSLLVFALSLLLGLSHLEQGFVIVALCGIGPAVFSLFSATPGTLSAGSETRFCPSSASPPPARTRVAAMVLGLACAAVVLNAIFWLNDFNLQEDRISYFWRRGGNEFIQKIMVHPWATLYSLHAVAWPGVIGAAILFFHRSRKAFVWFVAANVLCIGIVLCVFDVTRVFSLIAWPVLLVALIELKPLVDAAPKQRVEVILALALVLSAVVPKVMVWNGGVHSTVRKYDVKLLKGEIDPKDPNFSFLPW